jgi:alpha-pyrone synthase
MVEAYLNQIATAVPDYDVHRKFVDNAPFFLSEERSRVLFKRMALKAQIENRYSFLNPDPDAVGTDTTDEFYRRGAYPDTETRMRFYKRYAFTLARRALDQLDFAGQHDSITHLILTTCTGFYAPGIDLQVVEHYGLNPSVERTVVGFMGCYAGINALKLARHIVRSEPSSKVAVLNLEMCTIHLQETDDLEQVLSFLIFADGCSASLVSCEPAGIELQSFRSTYGKNWDGVVRRDPERDAAPCRTIGRRRVLLAVELTLFDGGYAGLEPVEGGKTPGDAPIRYETADLFSLDPSRRADFIVSSLFTHHLTDGDLIR